MTERFGNYELIRPLAKGGMAEVFLARFTGVEGFERQVVIKRMLPELATRKDFVDMFLDEARLAARFSHPSIVQVNELGERNGAYFMAMEYVDGPHLGVLFAHSLRIKKPLPISVCCFIMARAAEGLHHAHELKDAQGQPLNIVHRDVSPQNILVSRDGDVKVMDFGVAKAAANTTQTRTGVIKGKIGYMSPEQCLANPLDRRTDVFALGIVLYELVTRRRLFRDKSDLVVMQKITMEDVPAPSSVNPRVPKELDGLLLGALQRNPDERTPTALQLSDELDMYLATQPEGATRSTLARWMRDNGADLGPGAGGDGGLHPTPSWKSASPSVKPSRPALPAVNPDISPSADTTAYDPAAPNLATPAAPLPHPVVDENTPVDEPEEAAVAPPPAATGSRTAWVLGAVAAALVVVAGGSWVVWQGGGASVADPVSAASSGAAGPASGAVAAESGSAPSGSAAVEPAASAGAPAAAATPTPTPTATSGRPPGTASTALRILTQPPLAQITVNKKPRGTCANGALLVEDLPAQPPVAEVLVELEGYEPLRLTVPLTLGETVTLPLLRMRKASPGRAGLGTFEITSEPSNVRVAVDGRTVGRTPLMRVDIKPGNHNLLLDAPAGFKDTRAAFKSVGGVKQTLHYVLEKKREAPEPRNDGPKTGRLTLDTTPWTYVYYGNRNLGPTPITEVELPTGRVVLKLRRDGSDGCRVDAARAVEVVGGKTTKRSIALPAKDQKGDCN